MLSCLNCENHDFWLWTRSTRRSAASHLCLMFPFRCSIGFGNVNVGRLRFMLLPASICPTCEDARGAATTALRATSLETCEKGHKQLASGHDAATANQKKLAPACCGHERGLRDGILGRSRLADEWGRGTDNALQGRTL